MENGCRRLLHPATVGGGQAKATMDERLDFSALSVEPKSFKVEGTVEVDENGSQYSYKLSKSFTDNSTLKTIDLSGVKFRQAIYAGNMFHDCKALESVKLPAGMQVKGAESMFNRCFSLQSIDLDAVDFSKTTRLEDLFSECFSLKSIDLSKVKFGQGVNASSMFRACEALESVKLPAGMQVTNAYYMFLVYSSLESLDLSGTDFSMCTDAGSMFEGCSALKQINLSGVTFQSCTNFADMFSGCSSLTALDLSGFDTSNAKIMQDMFKGTFPTTIKLGTKFLFEGSGNERQTDMPSDASVWNGLYSGNWISSADGKTYGADEVPSGVAATYTAEKAAKPTIKFTDVDASTAHDSDIEWLAEQGISAGWTEADGTKTFRPFNEIARADMAAFLYRLAGSPQYTAPGLSPFTDVSRETPHYKEICWLASKGWDLGNGKAEFRPYGTVARADMAAFLYRLADSPDYETGGKPFADCGSSTAHYKEVCWLASTGVSEGWKESNGTKTFRPFNTVARADMAAFLHRMSDKDLV